jgi:hypothetical protein
VSSADSDGAGRELGRSTRSLAAQVRGISACAGATRGTRQWPGKKSSEATAGWFFGLACAGASVSVYYKFIVPSAESASRGLLSSTVRVSSSKTIFRSFVTLPSSTSSNTLPSRASHHSPSLQDVRNREDLRHLQRRESLSCLWAVVLVCACATLAMQVPETHAGSLASARSPPPVLR